MGTGACLLDKDSDMPCGLIIEKVNGIPCEKRLASEDGTFADVRYLLEMCRQVRHTARVLSIGSLTMQVLLCCVKTQKCTQKYNLKHKCEATAGT